MFEEKKKLNGTPTAYLLQQHDPLVRRCHD
jgi:hypothetical protein